MNTASELEHFRIQTEEFAKIIDMDPNFRGKFDKNSVLTIINKNLNSK
jgi:hypothetical protein